jgi:hypothetical protein
MFEADAKPIWWLPTLGFFLFLGIEFFGLFVDPSRFFADPGVARHLRTGEFILATGRVPRTDPLSFTHGGEPWVDYEWAFETTVGELERVGGLGLVCAFGTALFAATILGIFRTLLHAGLSVTAVMIVTALAFLTLHLHYSMRPVLFTYLFMALVVEVWTRRIQPLQRDWIMLPLVFVAWANLHAGWAAALIFLCGAVAGRVIDRLRKTVTGEDAPVIPWIALILVCALATSINPWGWQLYRHVFLLATSYKSIGLLNESQPPNFSDPRMSAYMILFIVLVFFLARTFRRAPAWHWEAVVPVLFFLYEGLKTQRHVLLLTEVAAVPLGRELEVVLHGTWLPFVRDRLRQFQARQRLAQGDVWLSVLVGMALTALFLKTPLSHRLEVGPSVTPRLLAFVRDHPDRFHRPLNTTGNAGPLLWNLRPDFRVAFDDRFDFYGDPTVYAFVNLYNGAPGWRQTLEQGRFDSALLEPELPLGQLLGLRPDWKAVYRDKTTVVFWHTLPVKPASPRP